MTSDLSPCQVGPTKNGHAGRPLPGGVAAFENSTQQAAPPYFQLAFSAAPRAWRLSVSPPLANGKVFRRKGPFCVLERERSPGLRLIRRSHPAPSGIAERYPPLLPFPSPRQALVADMLENRSFAHPFAENSRRFSRWKTARFSPLEKPCSSNAHRGFCRFPVAVENNSHPLSMDF